MNPLFKKFALILLAGFLIPSWGQASQKYDVTLLISATTIMQKIKQNKRIFLVDIRHQKEFNQFKIPGSINIPLSFIKTKSFLKTNPVVIVHKGFGYSSIIEQVKGLRQKGFDAKILKGGLLAWKQKGGALEGDPFSPEKLNSITPKMLFMEKDYDQVTVINACEKSSKKIKSLIPKAIHAPKNQWALPKNDDMRCVVIFNETGKDYDRFKKDIPKIIQHRVFYLQGGIQAYQKFINFQLLANKPKSQRTKEIGHCEPCKKKEIQ